MKNVFIVLLVILGYFSIACSDSNSTNNPSSSGYAVKMQITGDKTLEFKTNDVTLLYPPNNPNFIVSCRMKDNLLNHTFLLTIDTAWVGKTNIDLTLGNNKATFAYNDGKEGNTYRLTSGNLIVESLNASRVKAKISFTATKIATTVVTISVTDGVIDITK